MVRVNLVNPKKLADQHLIAEYNEILMLIAYIRNYPELESVPKRYCLGKGHMKFFKDKVLYLKNRHESLKREMKKRGFQANKIVNLKGFEKNNLLNWNPKKEDINIITKRIISKLRLKPNYYRYYGDYKPVSFFVRILRKA